MGWEEGYDGTFRPPPGRRGTQQSSYWTAPQLAGRWAARQGSPSVACCGISSSGKAIGASPVRGTCGFHYGRAASIVDTAVNGRAAGEIAATALDIPRRSSTGEIWVQSSGGAKSSGARLSAVAYRKRALTALVVSTAQDK